MNNTRTPLQPLATFIFAALVASGAQAQSYADTVWNQLQDWYDDYSDDGYSVKNYVVGTLDEDEQDSWTFYFEGGFDYKLVGVCDENCDDIDMAIYDDKGRLIDEDTLSDDYPIVSLVGARSGRYRIELDMYSCSVEPCYFGFAIFYE